MKILIEAGHHTRRDTPVSFTLPSAAVAELAREGALALREDNGREFRANCVLSGDTAAVTFILDFLPAGEKLVLSPAAPEKVCRCTRCEDNGHGLDIIVGGEKYTEYYTGTDIPKPYLGPICEMYGSRIVRLDPTVKEHPHHRSVWVSHGSVNGVDTWNEPAGKHGFERCEAIEDVVNGPAMTAFTAKNRWTDFGGAPLLNEVTRYTLYNTSPQARVIDIQITLKADFGDVTLGRTKEAGPLAVRMGDNLTVKNTGRMVNSYGGVNEKEIWMKRAEWMDYTGTTPEGHACGIAVFDSPVNEGYPTYWHSRDYGLMAVNNFFIPGDRVIKAGESMSWSFRLVAHNGGPEDAAIAQRYNDFVAPPAAAAE